MHFSLFIIFYFSSHQHAWHYLYVTMNVIELLYLFLLTSAPSQTSGQIVTRSQRQHGGGGSLHKVHLIYKINEQIQSSAVNSSPG